MKLLARLVLTSPLLVACGPAAPPPTAPATPTNPAPGEPLVAEPGGGGAAGSLSVVCNFDEGWAAVVPRSVYRPDQEYVMQALIGMAQDPGFWGNEPEYAALKDYPARPCTDGVTFEGVGPDHVVLVGKANTYDGEYHDNGAVLDVPAGGGTLVVGVGDLTMDWPCISCPRVYVWTGTGWELRGEVLVDVIGARAERTQRRAIGKVKVVGGQVRLKLAEEEDEVSHVDALVLEVGGVIATPATAPFATVDGARTTLHRGDAVELTYPVALPDGEYDAVAVATGYYVPLASL